MGGRHELQNRTGGTAHLIKKRPLKIGTGPLKRDASFVHNSNVVNWGLFVAAVVASQKNESNTALLGAALLFFLSAAARTHMHCETAK